MYAILYHLHNLKNVKNTHGGVLLLLKLQLYKVWYQIAQCITTVSIKNTSPFQFSSNHLKITKKLFNILKLIITRTSGIKISFLRKYFLANVYVWNSQRTMHTYKTHGKAIASSGLCWRHESNRQKISTVTSSFANIWSHLNLFE